MTELHRQYPDSGLNYGRFATNRAADLTEGANGSEGGW